MLSCVVVATAIPRSESIDGLGHVSSVLNGGAAVDTLATWDLHWVGLAFD